jgi:hypothetical protein
MYFAPVDEARVYRVEDTSALVLSAPVPEPFAQFVTETILEPRLLALAGRG